MVPIGNHRVYQDTVTLLQLGIIDQKTGDIVVALLWQATYCPENHKVPRQSVAD